MEKVERCTLTDEELAAQGIEIPPEETEGSFFNWFEEMFEEVFGDLKQSEED